EPAGGREHGDAGGAPLQQLRRPVTGARRCAPDGGRSTFAGGNPACEEGKCVGRAHRAPVLVVGFFAIEAEARAAELHETSLPRSESRHGKPPCKVCVGSSTTHFV